MRRTQLLSGAVQIGFLALAAMIGFRLMSAWWLLPLTLVMSVFGWLTDHYWKLRFYDIYSARDWAKFWTETLLGIGLFVLAAFVAGRVLKRIAEFYGWVL